MRIVILEDDHLQEDLLTGRLEQAFPGARVDTVATEQEFRDRLDDFRRDRPDIFVMDVMLRWTFPSPRSAAPPPEVEAGGYQRAGFRCAELVFRDPGLRDVPVVYYTILEGLDLDEDIRRLSGVPAYVRKSKDHDYLARRIRQLTAAPQPVPGSDAR
jgi:CheY-like chemotaxis protein